MKRHFRKYLLFFFVCVFFFSLVSCGRKTKDEDEEIRPNSDPTKVDEEIRPNSDPTKVEEVLEDKDYIVQLYEDELLGLSPYEGLEAMLMAYNEDEEAIVIYYFETSKDANEAWEELEDELKEEVEDEEKKIVVKCSGKMIYAGTEQAIKDAR